MIGPDLTQFKKMARKGNYVAVTATIPADLETPVSSFLKAAGKDKDAFLLESAEQEEHIGRYSIIGIDPSLTVAAGEDGVIYEITGKQKRYLGPRGDITQWIQKYMDRCKLANPEDLQGFGGGFVGYLGYENVEHFEKIKLKALPGPSLPQAVFFLCQDLLIFDHFRKQLLVATLADVSSTASLLTVYKTAVRRIQSLIDRMQTPLKMSQGTKKSGPLRIKSNMSRKAYESKVKRIKEYIRAGDCIQVVLSQRFTMPLNGNDFQIYRALRSINPSPYMFYFRFGELRLVGSSPELLVKKTGQTAEVRPIAGTRPRGKDKAEDLRNEENLKKSAKELAEHLMLVDLGRNDLGRVCQFDSIRVENFARTERYSHVMHLVSDVKGKLDKNKTGFDLLRATFPAGTVTGAPKIRAMQIINELELERRGPYAGSVGYFSFNRDMDMCIAIRTLVIHKDKIFLQAGAGIVKDSNPGREFEETVSKASALRKAIEDQGRFDAIGY